MITISEEQRRQITRLLGTREPALVAQVKEYNHVYPLVSGSEIFYLKTYTVVSAGDCAEDLIKFAIEMSAIGRAGGSRSSTAMAVHRTSSFFACGCWAQLGRNF